MTMRLSRDTITEPVFGLCGGSIPGPWRSLSRCPSPLLARQSLLRVGESSGEYRSPARPMAGQYVY